MTSQGNAGSSFLEHCTKPYYCCEEELLGYHGFIRFHEISVTVLARNHLASGAKVCLAERFRQRERRCTADAAWDGARVVGGSQEGRRDGV